MREIRKAKNIDDGLKMLAEIQFKRYVNAYLQSTKVDALYNLLNIYSYVKGKEVREI